MIPAAPYWHNQEGFHAIFGLAPRIAAASFVAFIVGSFANAYVMSVMKIRDGGKRFSARAIWSTVAGESCDSLIFFPLALGGVVPAAELPKLMIWQVVLKTVYEIIVLPVTIRVVKFLKHHEGVTYFLLMVQYLVPGLVLAWAYDHTGTLWSSILLHAAANAMSVWASV